MTIKIADKNWVLTAYDELSADGVNSAINATNQGKAALTTGNSADKGTAKISTEQGNGMKFRETEDIENAKQFVGEEGANGNETAVHHNEGFANNKNEKAPVLFPPMLKKRYLCKSRESLTML